jgi:hypothetical protein
MSSDDGRTVRLGLLAAAIVAGSAVVLGAVLLAAGGRDTATQTGPGAVAPAATAAAAPPPAAPLPEKPTRPGDRLAYVLNHPWWRSKPTTARVEEAVALIVNGRRGDVIWFDGDGRSMRHDRPDGWKDFINDSDDPCASVPEIGPLARSRFSSSGTGGRPGRRRWGGSFPPWTKRTLGTAGDPSRAGQHYSPVISFRANSLASVTVAGPNDGCGRINFRANALASSTVRVPGGGFPRPTGSFGRCIVRWDNSVGRPC